MLFWLLALLGFLLTIVVGVIVVGLIREIAMPQREQSYTDELIDEEIHGRKDE